MKKVIVKDLQGIETHSAKMLDTSEWIAECVSKNFWGQPERWVVEDSEAYDPSDVLETETREDISGLKTWVKLRAEYTIEIIDVTFEHALQECLNKRRAQYPTPEEFLNAYFDGGEIALDILKQKRFEVKAKYPKPTQG